MPNSSYFYALLCVAALATGQILFKAAAMAAKELGSLIAPRPIMLLATALVIYGFASLLWVWILKTEELGKVYPIMALAFVFVPLASHLLFGEQFQTSYWIGILLVIAGLLLTSK